MADFKATPEQWAEAEEHSPKAYGSSFACLLELRARVEQLENTAKEDKKSSEEECNYEDFIAAYERWLPIAGYEDYYSISSMGRVRSEDRTIQHQRTATRFIPGRILKTGLNPKGYKMIVLSKEGKRQTRMIHSMVAEAFIGARPEGAVVCHGPGGQLDNRVENLYYSTQEQNNGPDKHRDGTALIGERNHKTKLTDKEVVAIRLSNVNGVELAAIYGVSEQCISDIRNYRRWTHLEALEASSKPTPNDRQIRSSLVERVQQAINTEYEESLGTGCMEARAAIREVARWMDENQSPVTAQWLEEEAER